MRDCDSRLGIRGLLMAETLGLAMARTAAGILDKHREALARIGTPSAAPDPTAPDPEAPDPMATAAAEMLDSSEFQSDNAIFTAILDAANECLARFDRRPADQRWCDALLQILELADQSAVAGVSPP
ncbi:MAG: hypothetical protein ABSA93_38075 [Streptosporangiaceae bacterium]|jgi:hypothetical protein